MSRVDDRNRGWVGHRGRSLIRPAEEVGSTLVTTDVLPRDARPEPDALEFPPEIGTEAGVPSSDDRAEGIPHRWNDFETDSPMPMSMPPSHPSERPADSWPTIDSNGNLKLNEVIFGRFLVKEKLGAGGMGSVWLVQHTKLGCNRALKIIVPRDAKSHGSLALFEREAWISAQLNDHPNSADVHDADSREDRAYIEMDYVPGKSLDKILAAEMQKGRSMPLDWTARILVQLCDLLQFAHDKGIIHRDLKPSNLMLLDGRPEGAEHLKVLDFGIAKNVAGDAVNTYTIQGFTGTLPYASPEQADGHAEKASDIYSVGVILYELLTGKLPFSGSFLSQIAAKMASRPPAFREVNPEADVPEAVEKVVLRCLDRDPSRRPGSARELCDAFLAALPAEVRARVVVPPTAVGTEPGLAVTKPRAGSGRRTWAVLAVAVGLAGLGLGSLPVPNPWRRDDKPALPPGFVAASGETDAKGSPPILVHEASKARFILLPEGRFEMGTSDAKHPYEDEKPAHFVYLDPYYLQETEATFGQMEWFFETHRHVDRPAEYLEALKHLKARCASTAEALEHPAVCITRELAGQFAESIGGRLPTEAEYEYAARSGGKKEYTYVWGDDLKKYWDESPEHKANLLSDGTKPVGRCREDRTEHGIFDLAGNVREWCLDIWARYSAVEVANPKGPPASGSASDEYAIRGGSFLTPPMWRRIRPTGRSPRPGNGSTTTWDSAWPCRSGRDNLPASPRRVIEVREITRWRVQGRHIPRSLLP